MGERVGVEQVSKEFLREITGIFRRMTLATHKRVKRIPIRAAQFLQRLGGLRRRFSGRHQDQAPMRGLKSSISSAPFSRLVGDVTHASSMASVSISSIQLLHRKIATPR